jgi:uncharacterized protein with von Willebrand factor type A (vWA) domain
LKTRLLLFVDALRSAGVSVTVAETVDAMRAAGIGGVERPALREALAATLLKDEAERATFDELFDRFFAAPGRQRGKGARPQPSEDGSGRGAGKAGVFPRPATQPERPSRVAERPQPLAERRQHLEERRAQRQRPHTAGERLARAQTLQTTPFDEMTVDQVEECAELVAELARHLRAHISRRQRAARRGCVDIRRTLRRSIEYGGVPFEPAFRWRRPGRTDLVALCDCSHSVVTASNFLLGLLGPAHGFFRRVRLFAFVDCPVEISIEAGRMIPHTTLDLYARSDFGQVLERFWKEYEPILTRNTLVLILGDARNNRRPPRADILGRIHAAAREVIWLNPEIPQCWNTGDSVMRAYERHCDAVLAASNLRELQLAFRRFFRGL